MPLITEFEVDLDYADIDVSVTHYVPSYQMVISSNGDVEPPFEGDFEFTYVVFECGDKEDDEDAVKYVDSLSHDFIERKVFAKFKKINNLI